MSFDRPHGQLARLVTMALDEDLGRGDITTDACVPADRQGRCAFRARTPLVVCGGDILRDVPEDLKRGRIYLAQEDCAAFGVDGDHLGSAALAASGDGAAGLDRVAASLIH